jgi:enoyl-CoA hydratase
VTSVPVLIVESRGPVGWLTFNRPEVSNAMNAEMMAALPAAWAELDADPEVAAIVVTGAGRAFQTGLDMVQLSTQPDALREMSRRTKRGNPQLTGWQLGVAKPVIAAVNGVCAGGGLHFVADADVVIAATTATFLDPHVTVGQVSAFETIGLARRSAFAPVARLALMGAQERVTAEEALRFGWVSEVVAPEELHAAAQRLGEYIAANDRAAVVATKAALWRSLETGLTQARGGRG